MRSTVHAAAALTALVLGCTNGTPARDCPPGSVFVSDRCVVICAHDLDCGEGEICAEGLCAAGVRAAPRITAVDGDGEGLCPDAPGTHCVAGGLWVSGENLDGGLFALAVDGGARTELSVLAREGGRARVGPIAPATFPTGDYVLTVTNAAGSADQGVTFLQGPPGPDMTADELIVHINTGAATIAFARLANVAPLAHTHGASDLDLPGLCAALCTGPCQSCSAAGACLALDDRAQHGCTDGFVCVRGECEQRVMILVNELAGTCDALCALHAGGRPCVDVGIDEAGTNDQSMAAGPASCQTYAAQCSTAMAWDGLAGPTCTHHRYGNWTNCRCSF